MRLNFLMGSLILLVSFPISASATQAYSPPEVEILVSWSDGPLSESKSDLITITLDEARAPLTTDFFYGLAATDFYEGTQFHRIIEGVLVQGGDENSKDDDPTNDGEAAAEETIPLELDTGISHVYGTVSMSRDPGQPLRTGTQFFFVLGDQPEFDANYSAVGQVRIGMDLIERLAGAPTFPQTERPLFPAEIISTDVVPGRAAGDDDEQSSLPSGWTVGGAVLGLLLLGVLFYTRVDDRSSSRSPPSEFTPEHEPTSDEDLAEAVLVDA